METFKCNKNCFECVYVDCKRPLREDDRERCRAYHSEHKERINAKRREQYHSYLENKRAYFRQRARENYDTEKNTEMCRKWYKENRQRKSEYDRQRYLRKKLKLIENIVN